MVPAIIIQDILNIAKAVYQQVRLVQKNQGELASLVRTIELVVNSLDGVAELPNNRQFIDTLLLFQQCLQETREFISEILKTSNIERFAFAQTQKEKIARFKTRILELIPLLNTGLTAQQLMDNQQDRKHQRKDREAWLARQEDFYQRFREEQLEEVRLGRSELESIVRRQLASFERRISLHIDGEKIPQLLGEFEVNICDLKFEYKHRDSDLGALYHGSWNDQKVTIKWIDGIHTEAEREHFIREVKILRQLNNEHIISFYGAAIESAGMCLLMDEMEKGDLSQVLLELSLEESLFMLKSLAQGLEYLHRNNIAHGAIRPDSVAINQSNQAKWMNFGLVQTSMISLTNLSKVEQAAHWQAPEVWQRHSQQTTASDIYSFGLLLWTVLTKRFPYTAKISDERMKRRISTGFREDIPIELPESIRTLVSDCWQNDARKRPSMANVVARLQPIAISDFASRSSSPTGEELYQQALKAQENNDDPEALRLYTLSSQKSCIPAMANLGLFKLQGKGGISRNKAEGLAYIEQAAQARHVRSMVNLGRIYANGDTEDGCMNYPKALYWFREVLKDEPDNEEANQQVKFLTRKFK